MSTLLDSIQRFVNKNPPPWEVAIWTYPLNGQMPNQYSAGFFILLADEIEYPGEDVVAFIKGGGKEGRFIFITSNIEVVDEMEGGGIRFPYPNLKVVPEDFIEVPLVTISNPK